MRMAYQEGVTNMRDDRGIADILEISRNTLQDTSRWKSRVLKLRSQIYY